jgi:hypothetical protein
MEIEQIITEILTKNWTTLWLGFVTFVATGFIMLMLKNFIVDLVNYFKVRMSDLGYGAMIIWEKQLKRVVQIKFREIKVVDDKEIVFVPIITWLASVKSYPQPRDDQFKEESWTRWDGKSDRRKESRGTEEVKNGFGSSK